MTSDDDDLLLGRDSAVITPSRARMKFIEFLRNFRTHPDQVSVDGRVIYRDVLEDDVLPPTIDGTFLCARFFFSVTAFSFLRFGACFGSIDVAF